ncbi:translocation/assembly module TamB domain-containing protein [Lutibacter sp. TH_r2]|uniref:translocation/assembly module TamB domain-containing protein n=1 Tax=Lutibacter sp. TH_r2 TaxID=3082083 RepID=UPI00295417B3|nr:translocation/assembly module TamB domain-containing protein [Lutibacter sp. TH_r2]MDV7187135.1 translocation/assembly module TamB domain-containing protein [Lutibacter sp. TH_r2]
MIIAIKNANLQLIKRFKKILVRILITLLLLLAVTSILLAIPSVQTYLGNRATIYLQKEFDVDINVEKVDLSFLGSVQLKEIFIKDHHQDSLIYVDNLSTSILSYRNILNNKMEFGAVSLSDFILNIKTYKGEIDDALTVFVDKFDDGTVSEKPSSFLMTFSKMNLKNGNVFIIDDNEEESSPVFYKNITGVIDDFKLEGPKVYANLRGVSFVENHGIEVKSLISDFTYTKQFMKFYNTILETETSKIEAKIDFDYNREDFYGFNNKVYVQADVKKADISLIDLKHFYSELGEDDVLHFTTKIEGVLNDFYITDLKLNSDKGAVIKGDLNFINTFNTENGFELQGNLQNLTSDYFHLKSLLPNVLGNTLPSAFKQFGRFTISGDTHITTNFIDAQLNIQTDLGTAISDLKLTNIDDIDNASYIGAIRVIDFELGEIVDNPSIGKISLIADVDGKGFTLDKLDSEVKGNISTFYYNNYTYKDIDVNGVIREKHFDGYTEVNDENIKLNFKGLADFSSDVYTFNFNTNVDYCNLKAIKVFERDSVANIKGEIDIDLKGNSIDDVVGSVNFKNSLFANHKRNYFFKDFNVTSSFLDSVRTITINSSEIIEGRIRGKFKMNELLNLTQNSIGSIYTNYKPYEVTPGQELDFRFKIYNKIVEIFYPKIDLGSNTVISGSITSDDNVFKLNIRSPQILAFENEINNVRLQIDNKNPLFNTQLTVESVNSEVFDISKFHLVNITLNDTLYFRTEFRGGKKKTEDYNLAFFHTINKENKSVFGLQNSNFTFKNNVWKINPNSNKLNKVVYNSKTKKYTIEPFLIASKNQEIEFSGIINDTISKDLDFKFTNVKLDEITPNIDSLKLEGLINGHINYNQLNKKIKPTANLSLTNFKINNSHQGDLKVLVEGKNSVTKYDVKASLKRDDFISFSAVGNLDFTPNKPTLDVIVDFEEFKLDAFSPLGEDVFTNIRGYVYGNVNFTGLLENPDMTGDLYLDQAGLYFPYINVDYEMEGTSIITLDKQTFDFNDVTLKDTKENTKGNLTGTLRYHKFEDWFLDLSISTNNLLVLDTKEQENSLYYGTGYLRGNADLSGPTDKLVIDVTGRTNKGTYFVVPISDVKTIEENQLVRFVSKNKEENEKIRRAFISDKLKGLTLNFNLDVTKDAIFEMVLDKSTGSFLKGNGTGSLQISVDTKDKFDMYGDFIVDSGIYSFKYGGFINKPFSVRKGGSISWSGDPYAAILNIEAVYRVSANPGSLLENITTNRKIPIDLITRFSGELFNSQRAFDIEIPNSSSTVASELAFKLDDNDGNSKTRHFVSLLASGAFYNESDFSVNTTGLVYGTASDMLSNAFDNIFNQGSNKFKFKPVYTVGEKNTVSNIDIDDQLSLALDYQINDRILINGSLGVPIGSKEQSTVIGEVNVEVLLNDEGTLRSSAFNRQNEIQYSDEEEGYTQGIGLSYQIDFDNGKELLQKLGLKKKVVKDSLQVKKTDTIKNKNKLIHFKN